MLWTTHDVIAEPSCVCVDVRDKFLDWTHRNIAANKEKLKHFNQLAFTCVRIVKRKSAEED